MPGVGQIRRACPRSSPKPAADPWEGSCRTSPSLLLIAWFAHAVGVLGYRPGICRDRRVVGLAPESAGHLRCPPYPPDYAARHSRAASYAEFRYGLHVTVPEPANRARRPRAGREPPLPLAAATLPSLGGVAGYTRPCTYSRCQSGNHHIELAAPRGSPAGQAAA